MRATPWSPSLAAAGVRGYHPPAPTRDLMDPTPTDPALEQLTKLNRAWLVQQMLRGLAHDLRNHLQVLALGVPVDGRAPGAEVARRVELAIESMSRSIETLARFGRVEPDGLETADLGAELDQVVQWSDWLRNYPSRGVVVEPGPKRIVALSPSVLCQIVLNLVVEAKASDPTDNQPIRISTASERAGRVTIAVPKAGRPVDLGVPDWRPLVEYLVGRAGGLVRLDQAGLAIELPESR